MSEAVMQPYYDIRSGVVNHITICAVDARYESRHLKWVLDKKQLLAALKAQGVKNVDIERVLDLPSSRVSEILRATPGREIKPGQKERDLTYDEGVKLVEAFGLEPGQRVPPIPVSTARLLVRHVTRKLGVEAQGRALEALTEDLRVFAEFVSDPRVRESPEAAEGFFRALELRGAPEPGEEGPRGTDHAPTH